MLIAYEAEGCKMSLKVHFLHTHAVKIKMKDFTRMSMMSRDDTKEDGKSTCQLITVGYSGGKQKMVLMVVGGSRWCCRSFSLKMPEEPVGSGFAGAWRWSLGSRGG
ncbi:hypothetical protein AVEN_89240-1 [Araneus ventricosus]|uniref:Uncharacterized protein n=1 Tax=Araneus ventricosus TaxID=182803 RepID=A0A4Y2L238_ARAVE|nr:hypothetical protein AVEN_89240-1 [Araneus ventricosus]